jgi:predicted outer membrane repeat protein
LAAFLIQTAPAAVMAKTLVTSSGDVPGTCPSSFACTLRQAIVSTFAGDVIEFGPLITTVTITTDSPLSLNNSITIDGANRVTITGNGNTSLFVVESGASVQLTGLTIQDGAATLGGGIYVSEGGTLALNNSTVTSNTASFAGAGIFNDGTATLTNSTFSANTGPDFGGGIFNEGTLTMSNSTVSGNSSTQLGGGISIGSGTATMTNITVSNNTSLYGGGISADYTTTISGSIVAGNTQRNFFDIFGPVTRLFCLGDASTLNLGALANNGGPTQTILPGPGSTAINGIPCSDAPQTDQRGLIRPDPASAASASPCDVGAVEVGSVPDVIFVNGFELAASG